MDYFEIGKIAYFAVIGLLVVSWIVSLYENEDLQKTPSNTWSFFRLHPKLGLLHAATGPFENKYRFWIMLTAMLLIGGWFSHP